MDNKFILKNKIREINDNINILERAYNICGFSYDIVDMIDILKQDRYKLEDKLLNLIKGENYEL